LLPQKILPALAVVLRNLSDSTDLKAILAKKIPEEQERVKNFRKTYGATKIGEVTVDMVSVASVVAYITSNYFLSYVCHELLFNLKFLEAACIEMYEICSHCSSNEFIIRKLNIQLVYLILADFTVLLESHFVSVERDTVL
jgi:hypothetical protein